MTKIIFFKDRHIEQVLPEHRSFIAIGKKLLVFCMGETDGEEEFHLPSQSGRQRSHIYGILRIHDQCAG
jgi:hypothetical protein